MTTTTPHPPAQKDTHPVLPPPFHSIPDVPNFRDIGGYPIVPPNSTVPVRQLRVRKSVIYRGSDTTRITPVGEAKLRELGIMRDYDLRTQAQIVRMGGGKGMEGIERICVPLFEDTEGDKEEETKRRYELYAGDGTEGIVEAFLEILLSSRQAYRAILLPLIATAKPQPIFIHCTTGNNRSGALVALILALIHVPVRVIAHEYALSNIGLAATRNLNVERLLVKGAFPGLKEEERKRKCERMLSAREESVYALFQEVGKRWGGTEGFFREVIGFSGGEIEGVRKVLTEEGEGKAG